MSPRDFYRVRGAAPMRSPAVSRDRKVTGTWQLSPFTAADRRAMRSCMMVLCGKPATTWAVRVAGGARIRRCVCDTCTAMHTAAPPEDHT